MTTIKLMEYAIFVHGCMLQEVMQFIHKVQSLPRLPYTNFLLRALPSSCEICMAYYEGNFYHIGKRRLVDWEPPFSHASLILWA